MRNGYIIDTLTLVDLFEIVQMDGKVIKKYDHVFYRENFETSPLRKIIEKLFTLRPKSRNEGKDFTQPLTNIIMNICMVFKYEKIKTNHFILKQKIG